MFTDTSINIDQLATLGLNEKFPLGDTTALEESGVRVPRMGEVRLFSAIISKKKIPDDIVAHCKKLLKNDPNGTAWQLDYWNALEESSRQLTENGDRIGNSIANGLGLYFHSTQEKLDKYKETLYQAARLFAEEKTPGQL